MSTHRQPAFWRPCLTTGLQTIITLGLFILAGMHLLTQYPHHTKPMLCSLIALGVMPWLMANRPKPLIIATRLWRYRPWALMIVIAGITCAYALDASLITLGLTLLWGLLLAGQTADAQSQLITQYGMPHITRLYAWRCLSIAIGLCLVSTSALILHHLSSHTSMSLHSLTWMTCVGLVIGQAVIFMQSPRNIHHAPIQQPTHSPLTAGLSWALSATTLVIIGVIAITLITHSHAHPLSALMIMGAMTAIGFVLGCVYMVWSSRPFVDLIHLPVTPVFIAGSLIALHASQSIIGMSVALFMMGLFTAPHIITLKSNIASASSTNVRRARLSAQQGLVTLSLAITLAVAVITHHLGLSLSMQSTLLCLCAVIGAMISLNALPQHLMRFILFFFNNLFYRVKTIGLENIPKTGAAIILANHASGIDWGLIQAGSSRTMRMVINQSAFKIWYLNHFFRWIKLIPINRNKPSQGMKAIQQALEDGDMVCIFAEGHLTPNGQLNPLYSGFERMVQQTPCPIIPLYTHGLWRGPRSLAPPRAHRPAAVRHRDITVCIGPALSYSTKTPEATQAINALAYPAWQQHSLTLNDIASRWLTTALRCRDQPCMTEKLDPSLSHNDVIARVWHACDRLSKAVPQPGRIGILLPTSIDNTIAHLACWCLGHTVINMNPHHPQHLAVLSDIPVMISATTYHQSLARQGIELTLQQTTLIDTDDWHTVIMQKSLRKLTQRVKRLSPWRIKRRLLHQPQAHRPAVEILPSTDANTSTTLTHRQLLTRTEQLASTLNLTDSDVILASHPLHDGMGLVSSLLLPLLEGCPMLLHPDTLHINQLGKYLYQRRVSVIITTPDRLDAYTHCKKMLPAMLDHVRLVISALSPSSPDGNTSSSLFTKRFNIPVHHGYVISHQAAWISCNLPDVLNTQAWRMKPFSKNNSVGMPLPGNRLCVVDPDNLMPVPINAEGELWVSLPGTGMDVETIDLSPNFKPKRSTNWINTGMTASMDERGFVSLTPVTLPTNESSLAIAYGLWQVTGRTH